MARTALPFLLEESLGRKWYFTLSGQQAIEYYQKDGKSWTEPLQIDGQPVKLFCATIDNEDRLHLLAYNISRQLVYYEWDGRQWYQKIIHRIASRFENISYIDILFNGTGIHLFYYIENSLKKAEESLIHTYIKDGRWNSEVVLSFLTEQVVAPQLIRSDNNGNIFCIYTRTIRSQTRCYYMRFDCKNDSWSKPAIIFQRPGKCSCFSGETDLNGILHMVWVEKGGSDYRLNYINVNPFTFNNSSAVEIIQEETIPIEYPCIHVEEDLICFFIQDEKIIACRKEPGEQHWELINKTEAESVNPYIKVIKSLDGKARTRLELGDGYPDFKWTANAALHESTGSMLKASNDTGAKDNSRNANTLMSFRNSNWRDIRSLSEYADELNQKITGLSKRLDEFYTALYQIQDYIRQKDKSWFQMEAQVRKLAFELEQVRNLRTKVPRTRIISDHEIPMTKQVQEKEAENREELLQQDTDNKNSESNTNSLSGKAIYKNVDTGSGEIHLGNVSILINPEDDSDTT